MEHPVFTEQTLLDDTQKIYIGMYRGIGKSGMWVDFLSVRVTDKLQDNKVTRSKAFEMFGQPTWGLGRGRV